MNLLLDMGNSFIKWVQSVDGTFTSNGQLSNTEATRLYQVWEAYPVPERVLASNVVGDTMASTVNMVVFNLWKIEVEYISSNASCCSVSNTYQPAKSLGADRWMAIIAAYHSCNKAAVVIDCGTAVTIDLVNDAGVFLGGVILPGLETAYNSLVKSTSSVGNFIDEDNVTSVTATTTRAAVQSGVMLGLAGGIEKIVSKQISVLKGSPKIYITGGSANKLLPYLTIPVVHKPSLVFQGLYIFSSKHEF